MRFKTGAAITAAVGMSVNKLGAGVAGAAATDSISVGWEFHANAGVFVDRKEPTTVDCGTDLAGDHFLYHDTWFHKDTNGDRFQQFSEEWVEGGTSYCDPGAPEAKWLTTRCREPVGGGDCDYAEYTSLTTPPAPGTNVTWKIFDSSTTSESIQVWAGSELIISYGSMFDTDIDNIAMTGLEARGLETDASTSATLADNLRHRITTLGPLHDWAGEDALCITEKAYGNWGSATQWKFTLDTTWLGAQDDVCEGH